MEKIRHIAIIMDGNGRWAKSQNKMRTFGHLKGTDNVRNIAIAANDQGVEVLTLYAFSTENWKRPKDEVSYLMKLPALFFNKFMAELMEKNIRIMMMGEMDQIPKETAQILMKAMEQTKNNTGMILNFAMNYGSRREMILAVNHILKDAKEGKLETVDEERFEQYLMTSKFPPLDLLIRTSGEYRISNFLLWQLAYAELMFVDLPWPEFDEQQFLKCLEDFYKRNRRFGGI
ncbi:MAG: isoprenyl transferase [Erysipelotrichaceae bacterium]|nr:isoprenyl transferase [Erysipelotrichaceae bacterium]MDO5085537.1 isoprenyl transferase [Erysipelotrichaceae bacterium]